ncbi:MAG: (2Fe-2S)-binding protein [Candidatus Marsarchaeota archaeon]|nr:(2Fe-2S)-binding protein [Candidatus Marsarchaeota archaeon]
MKEVNVSIKINGKAYNHTIEPRELLVEFIRQKAGLTGTHIGCDTTNCGACTVLLDGKPIKSCTVLAVQVDGHEVTTIEGLSNNGDLTVLQEEFIKENGLQCGFCTPGMIIQGTYIIKKYGRPTEQQIKDGLSGNLCRCTGYTGIIKAIKKASSKQE